MQTVGFSLVLLLTFILSLSATNEPFSHQAHISLLPENRVSISWVTYEPYSNNALPLLYLSTNPKDIINNASIFEGYTLSNTDKSRYYHHCETNSLPPNKLYYYQPGVNASIFSFTSRNPYFNGYKDGDPLFTFVAYGDMGYANGNQTFELLSQYVVQKKANIDFIMHIGDITYADDYDLFDSNPDYIKIYDDWGNMMEPVFSQTPYMTGPGNHEATCHSWSNFDCPYSLGNFSTYRNYFRMPQAKFNENGGGVDNMWYSFDYKNVHFLMISSETDYYGAPYDGTYNHDVIQPEAGPFGNQYEFIKNDLEKARSNPNITWIIAMGHRPFYSSCHDLENPDWPPLTSNHLRRAFEKYFYDNHVDLYLAGHIHAYERTYPVHDGQVVSKNYTRPHATTYLTNGAAGNIEGHETAGWKLHDYTAFYNDADWGISMINIYNETHLEYAFVNSADNDVIDSIWVIRDPNPWN